jgi:hypothetical protein
MFSKNGLAVDEVGFFTPNVLGRTNWFTIGPYDPSPATNATWQAQLSRMQRYVILSRFYGVTKLGVENACTCCSGVLTNVNSADAWTFWQEDSNRIAGPSPFGSAWMMLEYWLRGQTPLSLSHSNSVWIVGFIKSGTTTLFSWMDEAATNKAWAPVMHCADLYGRGATNQISQSPLIYWLQ